jgi:hypothetical protein
MDDRKRITTLFQDLDVATRTEGNDIIIEVGEFDSDSGRQTTRVDGYDGFFVRFEFNQSGEFIKMGIWE